MIISMSGTDGVGKSTQLLRAFGALSDKKLDPYIIYARVGATPICSAYKSLFRRKSAERVGAFAKKLGIFISLLELIFIWCIRLPLLARRGRMILCDRYLIDTMIDLEDRYAPWNRSGHLCRFLKKHCPRPDISVLYTAPPDIIEARLRSKDECVSREEIERGIALYLAHAAEFDFVIDASGSEDEVFNDTTRAIASVKNKITKSRRIEKIEKRIEKKLSRVLDEKIDGRLTLTRLSLGNSNAYNFRLSVDGEPRFFVKLSPNRPKMLDEVKLLSQRYAFLLTVKEEFMLGRLHCTLMPWLDAVTLLPSEENGAAAADIIKALHSERTTRRHKKVKTGMKFYACRMIITAKGIDFPHKKEIMRYLSENIPHDEGEYTVTHSDVHRQNFMQDESGRAYLIDYENLASSHPYRDLVYAAFFHQTAENGFWLSFLLRYFDGLPPRDFWRDARYYVYLHLLEMIICEHEKGTVNSPEEIGYLADSTVADWHFENDELPKWVRALYDNGADLKGDRRNALSP